MKLVIDIPDLIYEGIKLDRVLDTSIDIILESIINGTPVPKGHGDLVDIGGCDRRLFYKQCGGWDSLITVKATFDMLEALPVVIEADKEN